MLLLWLDNVLAAARPIAGLVLLTLLGGCPGLHNTASSSAPGSASTTAKVQMVHDIVGSRGRARGGILDGITRAAGHSDQSDETVRSDHTSAAGLHIERLWQPRHRQRSTGE